MTGSEELLAVLTRLSKLCDLPPYGVSCTLGIEGNDFHKAEHALHEICHLVTLYWSPSQAPQYRLRLSEEISYLLEHKRKSFQDANEAKTVALEVEILLRFQVIDYYAASEFICRIGNDQDISNFGMRVKRHRKRGLNTEIEAVLRMSEELERAWCEESRVDVAS